MKNFIPRESSIISIVQELSELIELLLNTDYTEKNVSPSFTSRYISFVAQTTTPLGYSISHKALHDASTR